MAKDEGKLSFILYCNQYKYVSKLSNEQAGILFKHIYQYVNDENPSDPDDLAVLVAWEAIKDQLKNDLESYRIKCQKNKENIAKRWNTKEKANDNSNDNEEKKIQSNTNVSNRIKSNSDNDNEYDNDTDNDSSKEEIINNRDINISCSKQASNDTKFDTFWSAYPRKVGKDKCLKWFKTHKPKEELVQKMVVTLEKWKNSKQWSDPQYIPLPYTWLNRGGWDDELDKKQNSSSGIDVEWETLPELTDEECEKLGLTKK